VNQLNIKFILIYLILIITIWLFKLEYLPGLHGDEAWSGLKALDIQENGLTGIGGMNNYTGIIQPFFSYLIFYVFGPGVFQLRIQGVVLNLISLILIYISFRRYNMESVIEKALIIFSFSFMFLIAPRIAWEVNSYTLLFLVLLIYSLLGITSVDQSRSILFKIIFFITSILGTYNHIIFSCIPIAIFLGLGIYTLGDKSRRFIQLLYLSGFNSINLIFLFLIMRYEIDNMYKLWPVTIICILVLIMSELKILNYILRKGTAFTFYFPKKEAVFFILSLSILSFIYFHGVGFFQFITNYKILLQFFSIEISDEAKIIYIISGCVFIFSIIWALYDDLIKSENSIFVHIIITYLGIFCLYTTDCSFRYYISIFYIFSIYLGYKISSNYNRYRAIYYIFLITSLANIITLGRLYTNETRLLKPVSFALGNGKIETSAHFIPLRPLIKILKNDSVSSITYKSNEYFLKMPIEFYFKTHPWIRKENRRAIIDYDFQKTGIGFKYISFTN
jgi:hypothetical protein